MQGFSAEAHKLFIAKEIVSYEDPVNISVSNFTEDIQEIIEDSLQHDTKRNRPVPIKELLEEYWSESLKNHPLRAGPISTQDEYGYEEDSSTLQQPVSDEPELPRKPARIQRYSSDLL